MSAAVSCYIEAEVGKEAFYDFAWTDVVNLVEAFFLEARVKFRWLEMGQPCFS
jgi:hypothetical protein